MKTYQKKPDTPPYALPSAAFAGAEEWRVLSVLTEEPDRAFTAAEVAEKLHIPAETALEALAFWYGAGALCTAEAATAVTAPPKPKKKPLESADALPNYGAEDLSRIIEQENLAGCIALCQDAYGKVFSDVDIRIVVGLYDQLSLAPEYICLLIAFCNEHTRRPMRYVEKVAFSLCDREINDVEKLTAYIEKKHRDDAREGALRKLFGIGDRALGKKEEECFTRWCEVYNYDDAVIGLAYDLTVGATGKASVPYTDKILTKWNTAGCKNLSDVEAQIAKEKQSRPSPDKPGKKDPQKTDRSFDPDDFFAHALERSYGDDGKPKSGT